MNLLSVNRDAKTVKGTKLGILTGILYLAPYTLSGQNVCPFAEVAQCATACLNTAGRASFFKNIQTGRIKKTQLMQQEPAVFFEALTKNIAALIRKAKRENMVPMVRLNGTSDISWEVTAPELLQEFKNVQFYDYTKAAARVLRQNRTGGARRWPTNYHLTWSYSGANPAYASQLERILDEGHNAAVVFGGGLPEQFKGYPVINGDGSDVRPLDPTGVIVGLTAKGKAKRDRTGFVVWPADENVAPAQTTAAHGL